MRYMVFIIICLVCLIHCEMISNFTEVQNEDVLVYKTSDSITAPAVLSLQSGNQLLAFGVDHYEESGGGSVLIMRRDKKQSGWDDPDTVIQTSWYPDQPYLLQQKDKLILMHMTLYQNPAHSAGCFLVYSYDYGRTFTVPRKISIEGSVAIGPMLQLKSGKLLFPIRMLENDSLVQYQLYTSTDRGETWISQVFNVPKHIQLTKIILQQLTDERLICLCEASDTTLVLQAWSSDDGSTWTDPERAQIIGNDIHLCEYNGTLMTVYNDEWPEGISRLMSYDYGLSWEKETSILNQNAFCEGVVVMITDNNKLNIFQLHQEWNERQIYQKIQPLPLPEKPKGLSASVQKSNAVRLRWNSVPETNYYTLYRSRGDSLPDNPNNEFLIATSIQNAYLDTTIRDTLDYYYGIKSICGSGLLMENTGSQSELSQMIKVNVNKGE